MLKKPSFLKHLRKQNKQTADFLPKTGFFIPPRPAIIESILIFSWNQETPVNKGQSYSYNYKLSFFRGDEYIYTPRWKKNSYIYAGFVNAGWRSRAELLPSFMRKEFWKIPLQAEPHRVEILYNPGTELMKILTRQTKSRSGMTGKSRRHKLSERKANGYKVIMC